MDLTATRELSPSSSREFSESHTALLARVDGGRQERPWFSGRPGKIWTQCKVIGMAAVLGQIETF
jgi:hypothetical protein